VAINFVIEAEPRSAQGKGASRRLRSVGKVPAIVYGGGVDPLQVEVDHNELQKQLKHEAFYSHLLTLRLGGAEQVVVLKDLQRHPVRPQILHLDLQRVREDQPLRMHVPLHFKNAEVSPGVKTAGGVVEHYVIQVEVECLPRALPEYIEVDLSEMNINESVHLSGLKLPEGVALVEMKHGNDAPVAAIHLPRAAVESDSEASPAAAEPGAEAEGKE
jgi:LSU ribosomal protein L25P